MKKLLIIPLILTITNTFAEDEIRISNYLFMLKKLGEKTFIINKKPILKLNNSRDGNHPQTNKLDCKEIDRVLTAYERRIQRCANNNNSSTCNFIKTRINEIATQWTSENESPLQYWSLDYTYPLPVHISKSVINAISKKFNISENNLIIQNSLSPNAEILDIEIKKMSQDSRLQLISSLNLFNPNLQIDKYGAYLKTINRIVACDIIDHHLDFEITVKNEIYYTKKVSTQIKKESFKIYNILKKHTIDPNNSKEVQAAYIGYLIGSNLSYTREKNNLTIKNLFNSLIELDHTNLVLKDFDNQSNFEEIIYPDKTYTKRFHQNFSVEVK